MVKKRLIFTLLYTNSFFMLSRNFRLQKVGNLKWLDKNYNFRNISFSIDELIVLDVTRGDRNLEAFQEHVKALGDQCFVPIAAGGGIRTETETEQLLHSGADKVVVNTTLHKDPKLVRQLVRIYGSQCIVASIDYKKEGNRFQVYLENGGEALPMSLEDYVKHVCDLEVGEIYLNSMDKDGTGQGYVMEVLKYGFQNTEIPIIMAGGAGNAAHLLEAAQHPFIDAVATANLFNFVNDGLPNARKNLLENHIELAVWDPKEEKELHHCLNL